MVERSGIHYILYKYTKVYKNNLGEGEGVAVVHLHEGGHMELLVPAGDYLLLPIVDEPVHRLLGMPVQHVA